MGQCTSRSSSVLTFRDREVPAGGNSEAPLGCLPQGPLVSLPSLPANIQTWSAEDPVNASATGFVLFWAFWGKNNRQMDVTQVVSRRIFQNHAPSSAWTVGASHPILASHDTLQCNPGPDSVLTLRFSVNNLPYVLRVEQDQSFVVQ